MMSGAYHELDTASVALVTKLVLWIFAFDDLFDESGHSLDELGEITQRTSEATRTGESSSRTNPLEPAMLELRHEYAGLPSWDALNGAWTNALCNMYKGMLFEAYWRSGYAILGKDALPDVSMYVEWAWKSVGVSPMLQSMLIALGDPMAVQDSTSIQHLVRLASTAIRYANDIRSEAKEREEGNVNAILILANTRTTHDTPPVESELAWARSEVIRRMHQTLQDLHERPSSEQKDITSPKVMIRRAARVLCEFYAKSDYHVFTGPVGADALY